MGMGFDMAKTLSAEQEAIDATLDHIRTVRTAMMQVCNDLIDRAQNHDESKFSDAELPYFVEYTPKLKGSTYGSDEYKGFLAAIKPALDHHYANNSHHPEHYADGVDGMNLLDVVEMFCDWWAAVQRHADGDLNKSIEINTGRFNLSPQLASILKNTVPLMPVTKE